ncbi:hypothetical protein KCP71_04245 [Salmonella enterica subsp. enterica]|nr:hypothetical protein KCP71_04245 [Salmonella enterica subsp. enterica]
MCEYKTEGPNSAYNYYHVQQKLQCIWANNTCYSNRMMVR